MPGSKTKAQLLAEIEELKAERDSACASFSEALRQVAGFQKVLEGRGKGTVTQAKVFALAANAVELARYARALEGREENPGVWITRVEESAKAVL